MTITEFIAARLAEDETAAKTATDGPWVIDGMSVWGANRARHGGDQAAILVIKHTWPQEAAHIIRHDPKRARLEIAAKRAILTDHAASVRPDIGPYKGKPCCRTCGAVDDDPYLATPWPCDTIKTIAAVWSDHHDYQPEWATAAS